MNEVAEDVKLAIVILRTRAWSVFVYVLTKNIDNIFHNTCSLYTLKKYYYYSSNLKKKLVSFTVRKYE